MTVSSSKFATHSGLSPTAIAAGDCPTVISRCFWFVSGSTSTTEFAGAVHDPERAEPERDVGERGEHGARRREQTGLEPDRCRDPGAGIDPPDVTNLTRRTRQSQRRR